MPDPARQVTVILDAVAQGDLAAVNDLLPLVYEELQRIAAAQMCNERRDHTLQATALVHEAYLRLLRGNVAWENRRHFFGAAAEVMRRILIEHARRKARQRHGGDRKRTPFDRIELPGNEERNFDLLVLDDALQRMESEDPQMAEIVKLRFFAGLSIQDTAQAMGVSAMTVKRTWACAQAWLHGEVYGRDGRAGQKNRKEHDYGA